MKIEYICHAALFIDTGDVKIATDPWWEGPAYCGQWNVFPVPVTQHKLANADAILISHGHEDHLHEPTLIQHLPKTATVFYPYYWYSGTMGWLESMGFQKVREAMTFKRYALTNKTSVTFVANNLDCIMVIEHGDEVFVDVNDALHAHHPHVISHFVAAIRKRWPEISTVFCGFGGASYFPNCVRFPGKDDREIAAAREQLFAHNFCRIVKGLAPKVAVPFAADFALLNPEQAWINQTRFPRNRLASYYRKYFANGDRTVIYDMYPGDVLDGNELQRTSPYRSQMIDGKLDHLIQETYASEIAAYGRFERIESDDAERLGRELLNVVQDRAPIFDQEKLKDLRFCVRVTDVSDDNCYHVSFDSGSASVTRHGEPWKDCALVIDIMSEHLRYSFASTWGGDVITIGYCSQIHISDAKTLTEGLDTICLGLITRYPSARRFMKKQPWRGARFLMQNPVTRSWAIKQVLRRTARDAEESQVYDPSLWLQRTKCDVCRVCDLPLLDSAFASELEDSAANS